MANDKSASFSIPVTSNAGQVGAEGAAALQQLRDKIEASTSSIRQMSATMKALRGSSDEVKSAKAQLAASIEGEKNAISSANVALLKQGQNYAKLADDAKRAQKAQEKLQEEMKKKELERQAQEIEKLKKGLASTGDPIGNLTGRFEELKGAMGSAAGVVGLFAGAAVAAVAVVVGLTAAIGAGVFALGRWIVEGANLNRSLLLQREAWTGSARNALALTHQIDALARVVPTSKDRLNELAGSLVKALNNSRVSGQGIVDTFNAVAQASAAMGDEVGATLAEIIKAGKMSGRVAIVAPQLQGTGLKIQDIAGELAKTMHVSVAAAVQALAEGRVKVDDAAAAIRKAVEKRFGEINARKMLDLGVIATKLHESFLALTADVKLEPLLEAFKQLASLFDQTTVSGMVLHDIVTTIGNKLGPALASLAPLARKAFLEIEIGALKVAIGVLRAKAAIVQAFGKNDEILSMADAIRLTTGFIDGLTTAALFLVRTLATGIILAVKAFQFLGATVDTIKEVLAGGWNAVGGSIITGLVEGITGGKGTLLEGMLGMAETAKDAFKKALGIASPSKVFEEYGRNTAEGYAGGLEGGAGSAQAGAEALAPAAPRGGGRGGGAPIHVEVNLIVQGGGDPQKTATAVREGAIPQLVDALRAVLTSAGVPVTEEVPT